MKSVFRVHVLHKTWSKAVSRSGRAATAKKCTKKTCCQCTVVANLRPRPNVGLFMRRTKLGELSSWNVWRLAQLSLSEWVWVVQRFLSVCFRTEITALACRETNHWDLVSSAVEVYFRPLLRRATALRRIEYHRILHTLLKMYCFMLFWLLQITTNIIWQCWLSSSYSFVELESFGVCR